MDNSVSAAKWFLYIIIANLPFLNIISLLFWCFSKGTNINVKNWAKAQLLIGILQTLICILIIINSVQ